MADERQGWTDVQANVHSGAQDFWLVAEGPNLTPAGGVITITAGFHSIVANGQIHTINGAQRPTGQFLALRIDTLATNVEFIAGGNVKAGKGQRTSGRYMMLLFRDGWWEEQALPAGEASGVVSFNTRVGAVTPLLGDYGATIIAATDPTGGAGDDVQEVLNNIYATVPVAGTYVTSFNTRLGAIVPLINDYDADIVTIIPFDDGAGTDIPGPTVQLALEQLLASIGGVAPGGVLSFNGRTSNVISILGDYPATLISATDPTGSGGTNTQQVLNNLNTKIGDSAGGGFVRLITAGDDHVSSSSTTWTMGKDDISSDLSYTLNIPAQGGTWLGTDNSLAGGPNTSIHAQINALAWRDAYSIRDAARFVSVGESLDTIFNVAGGYAKLAADNFFTENNAFDGPAQLNALTTIGSQGVVDAYGDINVRGALTLDGGTLDVTNGTVVGFPVSPEFTYIEWDTGSFTMPANGSVSYGGPGAGAGYVALGAVLIDWTSSGGGEAIATGMADNGGIRFTNHSNVSVSNVQATMRTFYGKDVP